jgi:hypothetical protein
MQVGDHSSALSSSDAHGRDIESQTAHPAANGSKKLARQKQKNNSVSAG